MKNWKIKIIFFFLVCFSLLIIYRLYYLQIKKGEYYEALALGQQVSFKEIRGERGEVFFNDEKTPLAQTKKKNLVYIFPQKIPQENWEEMAEIIGEILGEEKENLLSSFKKGNVLKREISKDALNKIKEAEITGISTDEVWARFYPQEELASHVIGFLNSEGEGQYGIEGYYDKILRGKDSFQKELRSAFGYLNFWDNLNEPISKKDLSKGASLFLTLDYNIQYFSEKLLKKAKEKFDIDSGQIIVTDPSTGKILAMAIFPSFNSNRYGEEKELEIFLNPVLQKLFEPGSIFKPITFAQGLEENLITPETTYIDKGFVELGGPPIYNFQRRVWGEQSMTDVLEESINTGAVFVQQEIGKEKFLGYLEKFGFFEKTGIDLQGEIFSENKPLIRGYPRDLATASFGQGIQVTPVQLVRAFGAIANGGNLMRPFIVEKIVKANGEVIETTPEVQRKVISQTTAAKLTSMLISVVENGSGRRAQIPGYYITGKTGTAQVPSKNGKGYSETETIQSFIGFFPALNPQVLIFIKLDNPKGVETAGYSAAPLFRELAKYIIGLWQIPPTQ